MNFWEPMKTWVLAPAVTLALLGGLAYSQQARSVPADIDRFHEQVRAEAEKFPTMFGEWYGEDVPVPAATMDILQPNVLISRDYRNIRTGQTVTFLLVQSRDARHMDNHFPPICYPAHGWQPTWEEPRNWTIAGYDVPLKEYGFRQDTFDRSQGIVVANFMFLPGETLARDMDVVNDRSAHPVMRHYGAGQVHLIFDEHVAEQEREEVVRVFVQENLPLIENVLMGAEG